MLDLIFRLEETPPAAESKDVAAEFRSEYNRAGELMTTLDDTTTELSREDLRECEAYLDDLEAELAAKDEAFERLDAYEERQEELEALEDEIAQLEDKRDKLKSELAKLRQKIGIAREPLEGWKKRYEDAKKQFRITIPCPRCGEHVLVEPNSTLHNIIIKVFTHKLTWMHGDCRPPSGINTQSTG